MMNTRRANHLMLKRFYQKIRRGTNSNAPRKLELALNAEMLHREMVLGVLV